jgi:hypothetical protein
MEISVYSSDVRDFDEQVESFFDIRHQFSANIFDDRGKVSLENYEYSIEPETYMAVLIDQQQQIDELRQIVEQLKKKSGWVSGYDDHGWNTK